MAVLKQWNAYLQYVSHADAAIILVYAFTHSESDSVSTDETAVTIMRYKNDMIAIVTIN
jgi:hypothetical protein